MTKGFVSSGFNKKAFTCEFCGVHAFMTWQQLEYKGHDIKIRQAYRVGGDGVVKNSINVATCSKCNKMSIWIGHWEDCGGESRMIYPNVSCGPLPHEDMPEELLKDYNEARSIAEKSPRGAAALLRLCIQKLCKRLGGKGKDINSDIACLVQEGLPENIQKALDIVRVVGNNAVHPGTMSLEDNGEIVDSLFLWINFIIEDRISRPKELDKLYSQLPEGSQKNIEKRDS